MPSLSLQSNNIKEDHKLTRSIQMSGASRPSAERLQALAACDLSRKYPAASRMVSVPVCPRALVALLPLALQAPKLDW